MLSLIALALLPLVSLGLEWAEYRRTIGLPLADTPALGFDGVRWVDDDGVRAAYVMPRSSAERAGVEVGDVLVTIDWGRIENAEDADRQIERATGNVLTYQLERGDTPLALDVRIDRFPTFLYPLSRGLWASAAWAFGVVAFLHLLAYLTVAPLAPRSARASRARWLIGAALIWVGVNLGRIIWVAALGPPPAGPSLRGAVFDVLTLVALGGWIVYPALLASQSLRFRTARVGLGRWVRLLAIPPAILGTGVLLATLMGRVGPLPPDAFAVPILFYVCVYLAASMGALLVSRSAALSGDRAQTAGPVWSRIGSGVVLVIAVVGALIVWSRLGPGPREADVRTASFVVAFQLLSVLPVALVSHATLRHGSFDVFLARGVGTLAIGVFLFGLVVLADAVLKGLIPSGPQPLALGALVVAIVLLAQRAAPSLRDWSQRAFQTERQRSRQQMDRFGDRIRTLLDVDTLAWEAVNTLGTALGVRSAVVFLQAARETDDERWVKATYRPEAPTFTQADLHLIWERIRNDGRVWSADEELNEANLPGDFRDRLLRLGAALAVPVTTGRGVPVGLLVLGRKARRLTVYDTEDVERMKALAAQLALAVERLRLLDRERALIRQTADAEMVALRAQINPHFLFNALNTVAALIRDRPSEAESTVENLSGLFRDVLNASGDTLTTLRSELRLARRYLHVEEARFGDGLSVAFDVDESVMDVHVPPFSIQTLVENAVKHGIERKRGGGRVTLAAHRAAHSHDALEVIVSDTGAGLPPVGATYGIGLSNVAERLKLLYDDRASLRVEPSETGTTATLLVPIS
ncbi:MAG: histidine kinase [Bacteroidota bacterium]